MLLDKRCHSLALYLAEGLNKKLITDTNTNEVAVRSIRTYDALSVPLEQFPLLKVYRLTDVFRPNTIHCNSSAVITYSLTFTDAERLTGILKWTTNALNLLLLEYNMEFPDYIKPVPSPLGGYRFEYRTFANDVIKQAYPFLRVNITLKDNEI